MNDFSGAVSVLEYLDYILNTKRKRHIVGGILLSLSLLFGGLSVTVMTITDSEPEQDPNDILEVTYEDQD